MNVRLKAGVQLRSEEFGGVVYVHHRNDFFFLDGPSFKIVSRIPKRFQACPENLVTDYRILAQVGICETSAPISREKAYSGPSFIGKFDDVPKVGNPLVLNCFSTAFCPLMCLYCHADDLMKPFRNSETEDQLNAVIEAASAIPSLVAVISGGDPLTKVDRAIRLIEGIGSRKAIVIDTSGVPSKRDDVEKILPTLAKYRVHVRISIDANPEDNNKARPVNKRIAPSATSSFDEAKRTLDVMLKAGLNVTVQSVMSSYNDRPDNLIQFAQLLNEWSVKNWVIHIATSAGKAREQSRRSILPNKECFSTLRRLLGDPATHGLDVRVTYAEDYRNAVFLVGSNGDLYTEGFGTAGKVLVSPRGKEIADIWAQVNPQAHVARYSNWVKQLYPRQPIGISGIRLSGQIQD